jgi:hypothetical protein
MSAQVKSRLVRPFNLSMKGPMSFIRPLVVLFAVAIFTAPGGAQEIASGILPEAPNPQQASSTSPAPASPHTDPQTKRILGILPNFRSVSADTHLPPQTAHEKFMTATQDSFDYSAIMLPVALAGYSQLTNATPEFGTGAPAYLRYFWHGYVDQAVENYMVEFITPTLTHEDNRYYTLGKGHGSGLKRAGYALSRAVVTRNDQGKDTFNISEVVGAGAAAGISNLYYPSRERTFSNTADKWAIDVGVDAAAFLVHEFWPDINHALFHNHAGETASTP